MLTVLFDNFCRITDDNAIIGYTVGDYRICANEYIVANFDISHDDSTYSNKHIVSYDRYTTFIIANSNVMLGLEVFTYLSGMQKCIIRMVYINTPPKSFDGSIKNGYFLGPSKASALPMMPKRL